MVYRIEYKYKGESSHFELRLYATEIRAIENAQSLFNWGKSKGIEWVNVSRWKLNESVGEYDYDGIIYEQKSNN